MAKKGMPKWLTLCVLNNCFFDGKLQHLGLKYRGVYYCITHSKGDIEIPKKYLKMKDISHKREYLKKCISEPTIVNKTSMKISEIFMNNQILQSEFNKINKKNEKNDIQEGHKE